MSSWPGHFSCAISGQPGSARPPKVYDAESRAGRSPLTGFLAKPSDEDQVFEVGDRFPQRQALIHRAQVGTEDLLHHLPGTRPEGFDDFAHVGQPPLMVKEDLLGSRRSMFDHVAVSRIGGRHAELFDLAQRVEELAQDVGEQLVVRDERGDAGKDVVAGEEVAGA